MKKCLLIFSLLLMGFSTSEAHYRPYGSVAVSFGVFYSSLSSYGEWISIEPSVYAWRPVGVANGWRPYTVGSWAWTDDGWYWMSGEPWGWAAYHYGRWYYDDYYGWLWTPGYDWAPAWVEWRYGGSYIGWAPLGPYAIFSISQGIHYGTHWVTPYNYWNFVDCRYVTSPQVNRYIYRTNHNTRYIGRTRSAGSVRYRDGQIVTRGPEREYVERTGKVRVPRREIVDVNDRTQERIAQMGNEKRIEVYRPKIERTSKEVPAERPERVVETKRAVTIDTRRTDVGSHERTQEPRKEVRREGENQERKTYKLRGETDPSKGQPPSLDRDQNSTRKDRSSVKRKRTVEQSQEKVERNAESRSYERSTKRSEQVGSSPSVKERHVERPEFRSSKPERVIRRSEPRPQNRGSDGASTPRRKRK